MNAWRLCKEKWASSAFDGEGARRFGGRWNSPGTPVVYASESRALAALELLVHFPAILPQESWVFFRLKLSAHLIESTQPEDLTPGWNHPAISPATQQLGDSWVRSTRSPVLRVPSAIIPEEWNLLLNPAHPDFPKISVGEPTRFHFDTRLIPESPKSSH